MLAEPPPPVRDLSMSLLVLAPVEPSPVEDLLMPPTLMTWEPPLAVATAPKRADRSAETTRTTLIRVTPVDRCTPPRHEEHAVCQPTVIRKVRGMEGSCG